MGNAVEIQNLTRVFPAAARPALSDVSFTVREGELFALLGPNGGGKTTLFRILSTLLKPTGGRALIFGSDTWSEAGQVRPAIGVLFQHPSLDKKLSLRENLVHQGRLYGMRGAVLSARMEELLTRLRLLNRADDLVEHLSGGLQRRGEIAKGLLHPPRVLLMDEPSTGLDPGARREFWSVLSDLKKEGVTIMLTTHLMEEADKCDRLGILHLGRLVALGSPPELKKEIGGDVVTIQSREAAVLAQEIAKKFGGEPVLLNGSVRLERESGHRFIPQLVEAFPGLIDAVSVGKPTLEDVFVHRTGEKFAWEKS